MKSVVRILMIAPLALAVSACIDATAPRLPPTEDRPDTAKDQGAGYKGEAEPSVPIG